MRAISLLFPLLSACTWVGEGEWERANDRDGDGYLAAVNGGDDCDDGDAAVHPGAAERCNERDDDCDGTTDEPDAVDASSWYPDADGDTWGDQDQGSPSCTQPEGTIAQGGDCDDGDPDVHPGVDEHCDEVDEDCDGVIDEDAIDGSAWYRDDDDDGYGVPLEPVQACEQPSGYADNDEDCDDGDPMVHPDAVELLDGHDQDCDDQVDDIVAADAATWSLRGAQGYARAGECVQGGADLNSDGTGDLAVVVPGATSAGRTGLVGVWWGGALPTEGAWTTDDWTPDLLIQGAEGVDRTRIFPSSAGLGGGSGSLLLAAQDGTAATCHLFLASALTGESALTADDATLALDDCGAGEPWQIRMGGDLDGDGYPDLPLLAAADGSLFLLAGRAENRWNSLNDKSALDHAELEIAAPLAEASLVAVLEGDLDGDGLDDLLVGEPDPGDAAGGAGALYLVYGASDLLDGGVTRPLPGGADAALLGASDDHLGRAAAAADLDADGYAELMIGAPGAGVVHLIPGAETRLTGEVAVSAAGGFTWLASGAGQSVGAGVDIDGDAVPDVLVASAEADGPLWLVSGSVAFGGLDLHEDATEVTGLTDGASSTLTADLNGDGSGELLASDPLDAAMGVQSGALFLLPGYR